MFVHKINYVDFNGEERSETFHFHLSLPEVARLEVELGVPLDEYTKKLADEKDNAKLLPFLEKIILTSYGVKTEDGRSFRKSDQIRGDFEYSQAYAELFESLLLDQGLAKRFGEGIADNGKPKKNQVAPTVVQS